MYSSMVQQGKMFIPYVAGIQVKCGILKGRRIRPHSNRARGLILGQICQIVNMIVTLEVIHQKEDHGKYSRLRGWRNKDPVWVDKLQTRKQARTDGSQVGQLAWAYDLGGPTPPGRG